VDRLRGLMSLSHSTSPLRRCRRSHAATLRPPCVLVAAKKSVPFRSCRAVGKMSWDITVPCGRASLSSRVPQLCDASAAVKKSVRSRIVKFRQTELNSHAFTMSLTRNGAHRPCHRSSPQLLTVLASVAVKNSVPLHVQQVARVRTIQNL